MFHFDIDFKDKNGERHMLPARIGVLLRDLRCRAFSETVPLFDGVQARDGRHTVLTDDGDWRSFDCAQDYWGGQDTYIWFRHRFTVPQSMAGPGAGS